jgi:thioredoxin-related protein
MYKIVCFFMLLTLQSSADWHYNMQEAKQIAKKEHRHILLNFSGSDWCGPCILLRKDILDQPAFLQMADTSLILVNADFPRKKKNQLSADQQRLNDQLADQYNPQGQFPLTLLLNADGKILREWDGNPSLAPWEFSAQVQAIINTEK